MTKKTCIILEPAQTVFSQRQIQQISEKHNVIHRFGDFTNDNLLDFPIEDEVILAIDPDCVSWKLDEGFLSKFKKLQAIHLPTTSFSWIDLDYCKKLNIPVTTTPNFSTVSVAEFAFMMMGMLARKLPLISQNSNKKDFVDKYIGQNLFGKTVGIIGLGHIGNQIAKLCKSFGMKVMYWSANSRNSEFELAELSEVIQSADYIFPCLARNEDTKKLQIDSYFDKLASHQSIIAISEGYYNHELLLKKAEKGEIYGYAFDFEDPVIQHTGNVLSLPSYGWYTEQSLKKNAEIWLGNIIRSNDE